MKIYLAGPLFTAAEWQFNARLAQELRIKGHEVWLPQEHEQRHKTARQIFEEDVNGIDWAEVVIANMDGADPDSGTCWECGYAYGRQKPAILFRTDFRMADESFKAPYNLMLAESATFRLDLPLAEMSVLAERLDEALRTLSTLAR